MLNPIKRLRLERGLKQSELEELTGIPQPRLSRLEKRVQVPTQEEKRRLAEAFGLAKED